MSNNKEKLKEKILTDPDFIYSPKYDNSLDKFMHRHDEGVESSHAAKVLLMEEQEVDDIYEEAVNNLKKLMGANDE
jgi:hypothetical protein